MLVLVLVTGSQSVVAQNAPVDAAQIAFWQSVRDTKNPIELEAYLTAYPDGKFAPLAKIRLKALGGAGKQQKPITVKKPAPPAKPVTVAKPVGYRFGEPGWLGVSVANALIGAGENQGSNQATGVKIVRVATYGPARNGGLRQGDIILEISGTPQVEIGKFVEFVATLTPGAKAIFSILRGESALAIPIIIGGRFTDNLARAQAGDPMAQVLVGIEYGKGSVVEKDEAKARQWYEKAARQDNIDAQNNLGNIYWFGRGVAKDAFRAIDYYRSAAAQGHSAAQTHVGYAYANGEGARRDDRQAVEWYRKAAAKNEPFALNNLALFYEAGRGGLRKSRGEAIKLFRRAAALGNKMAIRNLKERRIAIYDLAEIQRLLTQLGFAPGPADGKMGANTRRAIRAFQSASRLKANGKASLKLATRLRSAKFRADQPVAAPAPAGTQPRNVQPNPAITAKPQEDIGDLDALD
ncbi:MAG: peptidoglycan-binding protein [Alphaproteobacteria bacterium]